MYWTASVDWITTTWRVGFLDMGRTFAESLYRWACTHLVGGASEWPLMRWAWQGYVGWQVGTLCFGERPDSSIVRVSGALASAYWQDGKPTGHNVSRLDIAVDVWHENAPDTMIALHNIETIDYRGTREGRPYKVAYVNGFGDGDTLYLGSRSSDMFGRIYNKEKESEEDGRYEGCTRYEVEYKNETARTVVSRVRSGRNDKISLANEVHSVLLGRGIGILGNIAENGIIRPIVAKDRPNDDQSLEWLRTQVAPTVGRLTERGKLMAVLAALGLSNCVREST